MRGKRMGMEDYHNATYRRDPKTGQQVGLFGVYDGHVSPSERQDHIPVGFDGHVDVERICLYYGVLETTLSIPHHSPSRSSHPGGAALRRVREATLFQQLAQASQIRHRHADSARYAASLPVPFPLRLIKRSNLTPHPSFKISDPAHLPPAVETFIQTDNQYLEQDASKERDDGCTAVVAVVLGRKLWVAHVGDSRAVLGRAGKAIALSLDHKPNRTDERERIENAGGIVVWAGTWCDPEDIDTFLSSTTSFASANLDQNFPSRNFSIFFGWVRFVAGAWAACWPSRVRLGIGS